MALSDIFGRVAGAQFRQYFYPTAIWRMLGRDSSSELVWGDRLRVPRDTSDYTFQSAYSSTPTSGGYSESVSDMQSRTIANHEYGVPYIVNADGIDIIVNKGNRVNLLVPTAVEVQTRPAFIANAAKWAGIRAGLEFNGDIRDSFTTSTSTSINVSALDFSIAATNYGNVTSSTDANNHGLQLYNKLNEATIIADERAWPDMGRYVVLGPAQYATLRDYLVRQKYFFQKGINDSMFTANMLPDVVGWDIYKDVTLGTGKTAAAPSLPNTMYYGVRGSGFEYILQWQFIRAVDGVYTGHDGTLLRGSMGWGAAVTEVEKLMRGDVTIT